MLWQAAQHAQVVFNCVWLHVTLQGLACYLTLILPTLCAVSGQVIPDRRRCLSLGARTQGVLR